MKEEIKKMFQQFLKLKVSNRSNFIPSYLYVPLVIQNCFQFINACRRNNRNDTRLLYLPNYEQAGRRMSSLE